MGVEQLIKGCIAHVMDFYDLSRIRSVGIQGSQDLDPHGVNVGELILRSNDVAPRAGATDLEGPCRIVIQHRYLRLGTHPLLLGTARTTAEEFEILHRQFVVDEPKTD